MHGLVLIHDKAQNMTYLQQATTETVVDMGLIDFCFFCLHYVKLLKNIYPENNPKMHTVLSVCHKSMRFDIFTAKDHETKAGYEFN